MEKQEMEEILKKYDRIVIFDTSSPCIKSLMAVFQRCVKNRDCADKIFVTENTGQMEEFFTCYHMYEFSNRITVISDSPQYPGLLNYLQTGLLTEEEFAEALLG